MLIGIRYAGQKARPQTDTVAGSNLVWADNEQVHFVAESIAAALLKHPDVWVSAGTKEDGVEVPAPAVVPPKKEEDPEVVPLVSLETMQKHDLINFAQRQFGQKLVPQMSEKNMRDKIRNWMNNPFVGG